MHNSFFDGTHKFSHLLCLQHISLHIPRNLTYARIEVINLKSNNLESEVPAVLSSFNNLLVLHLSVNHFRGMIPHSLGNRCAIHILSLSGNIIEGSIPEELGKLSNLSSIKLSCNKFSAVPMQLF